jgi:hypothetical protein
MHSPTPQSYALTLTWREGKNFPENNPAKKNVFSSASRSKMTDVATVVMKE